MGQTSATRHERNVMPVVLAIGLIVLFVVSIQLVYPTLVIGAAALALGFYYWRAREYLIGPAFALLGLIMSAIGSVLITNHAKTMDAVITLWP